MSDDDDEDQANSEANLYDGLDGPDTLGFGPLVPTESERSLMERVRQELKHELKQVERERTLRCIYYMYTPDKIIGILIYVPKDIISYTFVLFYLKICPSLKSF